MGEAYRYEDDNQAREWYEKALSRLQNEPELKYDLAQTYSSLVGQLAIEEQ